MAQAVLPFFLFCEKVLGLKLTDGQKVVAKIAFGGLQPADLEGKERDLALEMFGGIENVAEGVRKYIVMRLGRGSGKTTLCSAYAVYVCLTADLRRAGPGDVPYVVIVAPDKPTAQLSVRMAREMIRSNPAIERLVVSDTATAIQLRRPDGRMVRIEAFAASRAGSNVRGKTILGFIADEAEFFTSNEEGTKDFAVDDKEIFRAMKPRMLKDARGLFISTPWPVETYAGKLFEENWGKPSTALAIKAPTILVRGDDPEIAEMIEDELAKDQENARRELFCELDGITGGEFFDVNALKTSLEECDFPLPCNPRWPVAIGCDLGFVRDSSSIAVVQYDGKDYRLVHAEELRPKPGKPLQPSVVIKKFAEIAKRYGARGVVADTYYRESLKEQLAESGLVVFPAPDGASGKADVFQRTRAVLHEGRCKLPNSDIVKRMVGQAKLVTSRPSPGGTVTIKVPRRVGTAHGDIVSAWVLAVHRLAHSKLSVEKPTYEPGDIGWAQESQRRLNESLKKQQDQYLAKLQKEVRKGMNERKYRQTFLGRS